MSEINELYQELILEHNRSPRNFKKLEHPTHFADGYNPLCGDHYTVYLNVRNNIIEDIGFEGSGCAISKSSASMMTSAIKGHTLDEAKVLFDKVHALLMTRIGEEISEEKLEEVGSFSALVGVREFPARIKCASLPWHALKAALHQQHDTVSTEK